VRGLWAGRSFREALVRRAEIRPGHRVLDLGCGRGALTFLVKEAQPGAIVTGLDVDEKSVIWARRQAAREGLDIAFDVYDGGRMPYDDGLFDRVVGSLVVHHLEDKVGTFREVRRVLAEGGRVMIADYGPPRGLYARVAVRVQGMYDEMGENVAGLVPARMREAGFGDAGETGYYNTMWGTMAVFGGAKEGQFNN
jgi:ubiquinone/menaquinone biosynthesis C-methylase UbiE